MAEGQPASPTAPIAGLVATGTLPERHRLAFIAVDVRTSVDQLLYSAELAGNDPS